jgi:hypothetical protein
MAPVALAFCVARESTRQDCRKGDHMLEVTGLGGIILLILDVWAIVSVIGSAESTGKKVLWVLLVLLLPLLGFIIWLIAGPRSV